MFRHFPEVGGNYQHRSRDYYIALFTFVSISLCLWFDADASKGLQNTLGVFAWGFLFIWLKGENKFVRMQVIVAIMFATVGEHFASPFMGGYTYRFHNVPAYIPPGHGFVYLTAVALGRSGFFHNHSRTITAFVLIVCGLWSIWGVLLAERGDWVGAALYCVFVLFVFKGRSPLLYLAAFFVTTWLEIIGTYLGTWYWAVIDPVLDWPQGNPPSGVAAWYCLVDAVALGGAPYMLDLWDKIKYTVYPHDYERAVSDNISTRE